MGDVPVSKSVYFRVPVAAPGLGLAIAAARAVSGSKIVPRFNAVGMLALFRVPAGYDAFFADLPGFSVLTRDEARAALRSRSWRHVADDSSAARRLAADSIRTESLIRKMQTNRVNYQISRANVKLLRGEE